MPVARMKCGATFRVSQGLLQSRMISTRMREPGEETGLDTERQDIGRTEDRRSVGLVRDQACRRCDDRRFVDRLRDPDCDSRQRMAGRRGLADYVTSRWHLF